MTLPEDVAKPAPSLVERIHAVRGQMTPAQRSEGAAKIAKRMHVRGAARARARIAIVSAAVGALSVAALVAAVLRTRAGTLSYAVEGGHLDGRGRVEGDATGAPVLRFSDGSEIALDPSAQVELRRVEGHGARMVVVDGRAHVDIVHAPDTHFRFDAGPFAIAVTGTAFSVAWAKDDEVLDLRMERGSVEVSGPLSDRPIAVRSRQHLTVRLHAGEMVIKDEGDEQPRASTESSASPPAAATGSETVPPRAPEPSAAERRSATRPLGARARWTAALGRGDSEAVVREAEQKGIDACLATASVEELSLLADAARYGRHDDLARRTLLAERTRFPGTRQGQEATFLLGRLDEARGDTKAAYEAFDRYLTENAGGEYASEALGRKMIIAPAVAGAPAAREAATEYLRRFPRGEYASRARAVLATP